MEALLAANRYLRRAWSSSAESARPVCDIGGPQGVVVQVEGNVDDLGSVFNRSSSHECVESPENRPIAIESPRGSTSARERARPLSSRASGRRRRRLFKRNSRSLTPGLRIFVKLVEVRGRPSLAREVSRRSNTQNPVNPRMLMANSGPQLRKLQR
jgi:hypothetical protein